MTKKDYKTEADKIIAEFKKCAAKIELLRKQSAELLRKGEKWSAV